MGGGGASHARRRSFAPGAIPDGASSALIDTRTREGRAGSADARVSRRSPLLANVSTLSTSASNETTKGRSRRGASTHSDRSQTRLHPTASERPSQPIARSRRPPSRANPARARPAPRQMTAIQSAGRSRGEPGGDARAEADDEPQGQLAALTLEEALDPLTRCAETRLPIAPSTLWKMRTCYVRGARPLHCTIEKRGKRAPAQVEKI